MTDIPKLISAEGWHVLHLFYKVEHGAWSLLSDEDKFRARVIERLMCDFKVDLAKLGAEAGYDAGFLLERNDRLDSLASDGVVTIENGRITVSKEHRFMVRAVAAAFDAYFGSFGRTHSKAA